MKTLSALLAIPSNFAQTVPESKEVVLSAENTTIQLPMILIGVCGSVLILTLIYMVLRRRRVRHRYSAR
jgi:hypothetical protein